MPNPHTDRNLLFGILALQADLVTRDALVNAMLAWTVAKSRPLGEILLEQGGIDSDGNALVEALVKKSLERHGDGEKSLIALSSIGSARAQLARIDDSDLHASLTHVSLATGGGDPFATQAEAVGAATSSALRFRILRRHAKGGLGQVFVALDGELNREVALKEIQDAYADDAEFRGRFVREAEITGGLEHPGIVPVYGLGRYADGRPFYAMRFIKGETLQSAAERFYKTAFPTPGQALLELRNLLGRFVDVCNAVAYAHSRGVLHRDLKPHNVMLGPYGESLVVDWGLAKPTDRMEDPPDAAETPLRPQSGDATPTRMGQRIGTPPFMSPEQSRGAWDRVGPASDVYSLGATLYTVLTGRAPFTQTNGDLFGRIERGQFPQPRQVNPAVPRALESVCLKAMRLKPEDRYTTPRELADDLEHWLADEPVTAHREPWLARLGRWGRRHRPLVAGAAALLLTTVVALTASLVLLGREQAHTAYERDRADGNAKAASEQRALALGTLKDVVFDIDAELRSRPNMQDLRQRLLNKAQKGLQQVVASTQATAEADHSMIWSHFAMGDIFLVLGQMERAGAQFEEGRRIALGLFEADAQNRDAQYDLAVAYQKLGGVSMRLGQAPDSVRLYFKGLEIMEAWAIAESQGVEAQNELIFAYLRFAEANLQAGDAATAHVAFGKALRAYQRSVGAPESPLDFINGRIVPRQGAAGFEADEARKALRLGAEFLEKWQEVVRADPRNLQGYRNLALAFENLAELAMESGDVLNAWSKALALRAVVAHADPTNVDDQARLVSSYRSLGAASLVVGRTPAAREAFSCWRRLNNSA